MKTIATIMLVVLLAGCASVTTIRKDPNTGEVTESKTEFSFGLLTGPALIVPACPPYCYPYPTGFGYYYGYGFYYPHPRGGHHK